MHCIDHGCISITSIHPSIILSSLPQARQLLEREFSALLTCITERTQDGSEFVTQHHTSTHLA